MLIALFCRWAAMGLMAAVAANALVCIVATAMGAVQALGRHRSGPGEPPASTPVSDAPFVSVHLAIHDEPPEIVSATLNALARLAYPAFEVVVIDNNTADPQVWTPVARHVETLGPRFRFLHREGVTGAKAGALNIALAETDERASYVAVVDADYQVRPDFLTTATRCCVGGARFVQFPQAYRRDQGAEWAASELGDYFRTFPAAANRADSSLLTGTLSLISIDALRQVGGWPTGSLTEDAALGVSLWRAGARGRYVDKVVGDGLLPLDLKGLRTQRRRWAAGNMQVLLAALRPGGGLAGRGGGAVFGQLTAWTGFMALPLLALTLTALLPAMGDEITRTWTQALATLTIAATLLGAVARSLAGGRPGALFVSLSLIWTSSLGWLPALIGRKLRFHRTPKARGRETWRPSLDLVGGGVALLLAARFWLDGSPLTAAVLAASASGLLTAPFVDRALRRAALRDEATGLPSLIVIPTYDRAHQIGRAVEAALAQTQHDVEVAVVDDGSSDQTQAACERFFAHPRFVYLRLGANLGTAGAKNAALALLPFDAVTFHDSDDLPHPDKLIRQERVLARTDLAADPCLPWGLTGGGQAPGGRALIDIVLTAHRFIRADGGEARIARTLSLVDDFFPNLQFATGPLGDWVLINSGLFHRDLFARIGGYRDSVEEDRELRNRALMAGANVWFIDDVLLSKYEQPDSLTAQAATGYRSDRRERDRAAVWEAVARWREGAAFEPAPIDLRDVGLAFASAPERLRVAEDIPMTASTKAWLTRAVQALGR